MRVVWFQVYKTFRGGKSKKDYIIMPACDEDMAEDYARSWAENSPGGENYGWTVYWKKIDRPPDEWIEAEIERLEKRRTTLENRIKMLKKI